ncbi:MAG TPA: CDP-glucose 4,6-dehydratase [Candidatus Avirikenella pullistercoris]|nr:CDP-glucose 4,6-dehydratase [Candidatus Avirikenella pullistercoris]
MGKMVNVFFGNIYYGKKVLITGNTGFKGSWLTCWLLELGAKIYGISKDIPTSPSMFEELHLKDRIVQYMDDIRDKERIKRIIDEVEPDFVFHLAAQPIVSLSYSEPVDTISTNVMGTTHILEALRLYNKPCFVVIITSDKCYDNVEWVWGYKETDALGGKDVYSGSKGAAEIIFKCYYNSFFKRPDCPIKLVTARAGNVIGGGDWALDRIVPDCMRSWSNNRFVEIRSPKATRPWQHVLEPLSGYLQLAEQLYKNPELTGESFNFGPQAEYSHTVQELLEDLSRCWHYKNAKEAYRITGDIKFHEAGLLKLNCDKALFYLKWMPTLDYHTLIHFTGDWYYVFYQRHTDMFAYTIEQIKRYQQIAEEKGLQWTK